MYFLCVCVFVFSPGRRLDALTGAEARPLLMKPPTLVQAEQQARKLMEAMTLQERFDFVCGIDQGVDPAIKGVSANVGPDSPLCGIRGVARLGIPKLEFRNSGNGCAVKKEDQAKSTAFPCTLLLAATWDTELARAYANAIAEEFRATGNHFILGPGMEIQRYSRCGRGFEYFGEDPFLASRMVAEYVRGAQQNNVAVTLKHFLGSGIELLGRRRACNNIIDERTMQEIYLPPFKAGIDAGAWAVMTAYNLVNDEWPGENRTLITDILKKQLGFRFLVMTDWGSVWHGTKVAASGTDLEMPHGQQLIYDKEKILGTPDVDRMVTNILLTGIASGLYELAIKGEFKKPELFSRYPAHAEVAKRVNQEGIVLLRNNGILPLQPRPVGKILVTGNSAGREELCGGGSGFIRGYDLQTYLKKTKEEFGAENVLFKAVPTDEEIRSAGIVLAFVGRPLYSKKPGEVEGEGDDFNFLLPEDALIQKLVALNPRTVVVLTCGGAAEMEWADQAAAIVWGSYGGQTGPAAMLDVLTGRVNPSGKLPITMEKHFSDSPAAGILPAALRQRSSRCADPVDLAVRARDDRYGFLTNPEYTKCFTYDVPYSEGVFVGYRWYDVRNLEPQFPFGHGLSYTTFDFSDLKLSSPEKKPGSPVTVSATVKNSGKCEGTEVVEVYVSEQNPSVPRPLKELKGFQRVTLKPGESKTVSIPLNDDAFSFYDVKTHFWTFNPGKFEIQVGASSRDIRLKQPLQLLPKSDRDGTSGKTAL